MPTDRAINAHHVILTVAVMLVLFGAWRLVVVGNEPANLITFLLGGILFVGVLGRMRRSKPSSGVTPASDDDRDG
jgi:uncharacterized membrane protein